MEPINKEDPNNENDQKSPEIKTYPKLKMIKNEKVN